MPRGTPTRPYGVRLTEPQRAALARAAAANGLRTHDMVRAWLLERLQAFDLTGGSVSNDATATDSLTCMVHGGSIAR